MAKVWYWIRCNWCGGSGKRIFGWATLVDCGYCDGKGGKWK